MSLYDNTGRIHKKAFLVSNLVLFVLCLISAGSRFYIRVYLQKNFSLDDGFLLFGIACLVCAMGLLFTFVDQMYLVGASEAGAPGLVFPPDFLQQAFSFQKLVTVALILTWCSIVAVKFSYLFLFKRLIDRIRPLVIYWWVVAVFNGVISAYGAAIYIVACPKFYTINALQCAFGEGLHRSISFSISQMVLDIFGDLLILLIPCRLIWKIKIRWTQKIALASCLCLTILTIMCTITRISGIHTGRSISSIDSVWETYWQFIAANLALTMTAATAFRTFFVTKDARPQSPASQDSWYAKSKRLLRYAFNYPLSFFQSRSWRSKPSPSNSSLEKIHQNPSLELRPNIPHGTITGIRTFINGQGGDSAAVSHIIMHSMIEEEYNDTWPSSGGRESHVGKIMVQREVRQRTDDVV